MTKMITEDDMSLVTLYTHMLDSGLDSIKHNPEDERIILHTESGTAYSVSLIENVKFVHFDTTLPLAREASFEQKVAFANQLNSEVFLPSFSINPRGGLRINYVLPYRYGLAAGQFMSILLRFGAMLEFVVHNQNVDGLINFHASDPEPDEPADIASIIKPKNCLLN